MSATLITLTGHYSNLDGTAPDGALDFHLSKPITNAGTIYPAGTAHVTLDGNGRFTIVLPANDDSPTLPIGTYYMVTETIAGETREYSITIPAAAPGATIGIDALMPNTPIGVGGS